MKSRNSILFFIVLFVTSCTKTLQPVDSIPKHETFTIPSKKVNETRVINVWTPENYKTSTDSLPVMYMADGGIEEDFPHIANTLAELLEEYPYWSTVQQYYYIPILLVLVRNSIMNNFKPY